MPALSRDRRRTDPHACAAQLANRIVTGLLVALLAIVAGGIGAHLAGRPVPEEWWRITDGIIIGLFALARMPHAQADQQVTTGAVETMHVEAQPGPGPDSLARGDEPGPGVGDRS